MNILVTAFGPYDGRLENASSLALRGLKSLRPTIRTRIFPVDSVRAPARMSEAIRLISPDVILMLGEAAGSQEIRLETTAWNKLDFRIPDIAGRQPIAKPIIKNAPDKLCSTLPLEKILERLADNHAVRFSNDPGNYLCNQLFYMTRYQLDACASSCQAGFIHLPLAQDYSTHNSISALNMMIDVIQEFSSGCRTSGLKVSGATSV